MQLAQRFLLCVLAASVAAFSTGCYMTYVKGFGRLPIGTRSESRGDAPLFIVNNSAQPLFFYRSQMNRPLELVIPPYSHWYFPNLPGKYQFVFRRNSIHFPNIGDDEVARNWPERTWIELLEYKEYTIIVDDTAARVHEHRFKPPHRDWTMQLD